MLRNLKSNQDGVVFVTVLMIIIMMIIMTLSVISLNTSQTKSSEKEIKRLQAEILAKGAFIRMIALQQAAPTNSLVYSETIDNTTFTINASRDAVGNAGNPSQADKINISVNY